MRRWTDGKSWSPSRVTGSFLTYRELDDTNGTTSKNAYRADGLFKQSFSITTSDNKKLHLISYYKSDDATSDLFMAPSRDPRFAHIVIPKGIYPETDSYSQSHSASSTNTSSPSPPTRSRHRPHHRGVFNKEDESREMVRRPESSPYAAAAAAAGHRRTHSGSQSVKEHRFSPVPSSMDNSRSFSSHNLGYSGNPYDPSSSAGGPGLEKRYKSPSPMVKTSFPTPPLNPYSPTESSWGSDEEQPLVTDTMAAESEALADNVSNSSEATMVPPLYEYPFLASRFDHSPKPSYGYEPFAASGPGMALSSHEQDSLSVLADLATDSFLLPRPEPKEMSARSRWVEDDRQLSAVSSMLRL